MRFKIMENTERKYVVYKHTSPSNKVYIGITRQNPPEKRWKNGNAYKYNKHFTNAIQKHGGWDNFKHEILFRGLTKEEAEQKEIELIAFYKSNQNKFGYNVANGGNCIGTVSEETKKKLSIAHTGKKLSPEHIEKIRKNSKMQFTDELKNKLIELQSIEISQYYSDGTFIRNWKSTAEAERQTGICGISCCCTGNRKMAGGYIWRHSDEPLTEEHITWCNDNRNYGRMVAVCQYSMNGVLLNTYDGQIEAELQTGINKTSINNCCHKLSRMAGNYIWRYIDEPLTEEEVKWCNEKRWDKEKKAIVQFSLDFIPLRYFDGISDARNEFGYDSSTIVKCCKGKKEKAYGYIWKYASDVPEEVELLLSSTVHLSPTLSSLSEVI